MILYSCPGSLKRTFKSCPDFSGAYLGVGRGAFTMGVARQGIVATAPAVGSAGLESGGGLKRATGAIQIAGGGGGGGRGRQLVPLAPSATSLGQVRKDALVEKSVVLLSVRGVRHEGGGGRMGARGWVDDLIVACWFLFLCFVNDRQQSGRVVSKLV